MEIVEPSVNLIAEVIECKHGVDFCPYYIVDDDVCISCLKSVIAEFKKEILKIKKGVNNG